MENSDKIIYEESEPDSNNNVVAKVTQNGVSATMTLERFSNEEVDFVLTCFKQYREKTYGKRFVH